jgi:hypothetical protein
MTLQNYSLKRDENEHTKEADEGESEIFQRTFFENQRPIRIIAIITFFSRKEKFASHTSTVKNVHKMMN